MKNKRVSITDIAKALDVTPSTVSRALNGRGKVSEHKRNEILELAKKLGYSPNPFAKGLLTKSTKTIGLVLPEFTHHFYSRILSGIESVSTPTGYQLLICTSNEKQKQETACFQTLMDARVDGILATVCKSHKKYEHLLDTIDTGVPLVLIDRICEEIDASYVISDDFQGARSAVAHLVAIGCKKIVHIQGPKNLSTSFQRSMGYRQSIREANQELVDQHILDGTSSKWKNQLKELIRVHKIDGIFAYSDYLAYETYPIIQNLGLHIPNDIAIVGFADEPISGYIQPNLSTVNQNPFEMGKNAAQFLIQQIQSPEIEPECLKLPTQLLIRASSLK